MKVKDWSIFIFSALGICGKHFVSLPLLLLIGTESLLGVFAL